ncbi:MAG: hypothetical protein CL992_00915 [Euryarchaeota archaeon]|nr:hypothetical protein [Euryarchaeota archaeon]
MKPFILILMSLILASTSSVASASVVEIAFDEEVNLYRRVRVTASTVPDTSIYEIWFSEQTFNSTEQATLHSTVIVVSPNATTGLTQPNATSALDVCSFSIGEESMPTYRDSRERPVIPNTANLWSCDLSGLDSGEETWIAVVALNASGAWLDPESALIPISVTSTGIDELPPPADTSPILFALGSLALSLIALLFGLRWWDGRRRGSNQRLAHLYIGPALLALTILTFYPVAYGIWLSFTDADQTRLGEQTFNGIENYVEVFMASGFLRVTAFTLVWTVCNVIAHIGFGLLLALLLNKKGLRGKVAYRTCLLLPWAVPSYISVLMWKGMLQPDGFINDVLGTNLDLLTGVGGAQAMVILVNIWLGIPFMMMSISGALQSIPQDMYEAAAIDHVSGLDQFLHITLPNLKSALVPLALLGFIWTFNMFNVIYLLTDGGPNLFFGEPGSTDILITYVYDVAFQEGAYGVAAAWSVVIFLMLLVFSWYYMRRTNATESVT